MVNKKKVVGLGILGLFLFILGVALSIGLLVLVVFMFIWNINDIQNAGPNFWNVTWLVLASLLALGAINSVLVSFRKS